ncbi:DUF3078 domain-containing protein [Pontibacter sp. G13]|uniref:DUF3078 domain-containing protein n=1 Tax=Pontibacter sp. G13 TaxID=3074898 RepID=UPI002889042C|nr:DUF3078 domain-containing protein [Pontibacter sp. G13]WNJ17227.1 DUF3078 domain-containing protein [Pontibacter sp. G13]
MKQFVLSILCLCILGSFAQAQDTTAVDTQYWQYAGIFSFNFNRLDNSKYWQAGGLPVITAQGDIRAAANYQRNRITWNNSIIMALGTQKQGKGDSVDFIKNLDQLELTSSFGYRYKPKWLGTVLLNFRTQFAEGFEFPDDQPTVNRIGPVSNFMAPGYLELGIGIEYNPAPPLTFFYTPANMKATIVRIPEFRPRYIPQDITTGSTRIELGSKLTIRYQQEILPKFIITSNANFFMNYLQNFGNIDVNWDALVSYQLQEWLAISFGTLLLYDDDVKFVIETDGMGNPTRVGPRTQFQYNLTVGITYNFVSFLGLNR